MTVLGLATRHGPVAYWDIIERQNPRKSARTRRRQPRHRKTASGFRQDGAGPPNRPEPPLGVDLGQRNKPPRNILKFYGQLLLLVGCEVCVSIFRTERLRASLAAPIRLPMPSLL